jgi:hypothetical protein
MCAMTSIADALIGVASSATYTAAHPADPQRILKRFLGATMDDVRLHWADEYSQMVLGHRDLDDASHFRHAVMRREIVADIAYEQQRDHSAHTLYNYLLGWYFFEHCPALRGAFTAQLRRRSGAEADPASDRLSRAFGNVWIWASLLHDVGYLFEGGVAATSPAVQDDRVRRGMEVTRDFFDHRFWMEIRFASHERRRILLEGISVASPQWSGTSLGAVADSLRSLPRLDELRRSVSDALINRTYHVPARLDREGGLPRDAFDLWAAHYEAYGEPGMADRIRSLADAFDLLVWRGIPHVGVRMLDHGVCSGLLMLQYSTFHYALLAALGRDRPRDPDRLAVWSAFHDRAGFRHEPAWWWTLHVWGTAAAAIHNLAQVSGKWTDTDCRIAALRLAEDPIAYLGVLVDIIEEWDRYSVRRGNGLLIYNRPNAKMPLQSVDVALDAAGDKVVFGCPADRVAGIERDLDLALDGWRELLTVAPLGPI